MQHVLAASRKRLQFRAAKMQWRARSARPKTGVRERFYLLYFMHMNAVWQSLYVWTTKNCCALLTFTENFAPLVRLQDFHKCTCCNFILWMTHCLRWPRPPPRSCPLCTSLVTTLFKFYRCSKSMRTIALCMHNERWIPVPLWRKYNR